MAIIKERVPYFILGAIIGTVFVYFFISARQKYADDWQQQPPTEVHKAIALYGKWGGVPRPMTAEDVQGRLLVVLMLKDKCKSCLPLLGGVSKLEQEFGQDVMTLVVSPAANFAKPADAKYDYQILDLEKEISARLGVTKFPSILVINPAGTISTAHYSGSDLGSVSASLRLLRNRYSASLKTESIR